MSVAIRALLESVIAQQSDEFGPRENWPLREQIEAVEADLAAVPPNEKVTDEDAVAFLRQVGVYKKHMVPVAKLALNIFLTRLSATPQAVDNTPNLADICRRLHKITGDFDHDVGPTTGIDRHLDIIETRIAAIVARDGIEVPDGYFEEIFGKSYTPVKWGKHTAVNVATVREAMSIAKEKAPELGDVICGLAFFESVNAMRERFRVAAAEEATEKALKRLTEKHLDIVRTHYAELAAMPIADSADYWRGIEDAGKNLVELIEAGMTIGERLATGPEEESRAISAKYADLPEIPPERIPQPGSRWRHKVRGSQYTLLATKVRIQTKRPLADNEFVALYIGDHGDLNVRRLNEFMDGRFENVAVLQMDEDGEPVKTGYRIVPLIPTEEMWRALWPHWDPHRGNTKIESRPEGYALMKRETAPKWLAMVEKSEIGHE
jgi:hypothetical protein